MIQDITVHHGKEGMEVFKAEEGWGRDPSYHLWQENSQEQGE